MKSYIFQVSLIVFEDFFRLFHTSDHFADFSRPENFNFKLYDFPNFSRSVCTRNMVKTFSVSLAVTTDVTFQYTCGQ